MAVTGLLFYSNCCTPGFRYRKTFFALTLCYSEPGLQVVLASQGHRLTPPAGAVLTLEVQARGDYPTAVQLAFESHRNASQGSCAGSLQPGAYCIQEACVLLLRLKRIFKALTRLKLQ